MKNLILSCSKRMLSVVLIVILLLSTISGEVWATDPKVSIIIPVYNTPENLLRDCLESAKNQTLKDIEIICVDDGSTDGSGKILDEYAKNDPRFVVVHKENGGLSTARNKGIDLANAEYIKFLDSDDTIKKIAAEKSYNVARQYNADIVRYSCVNSLNYKTINSFKVTNCPNFIMNKISIVGTKGFVTAYGGLYKNKFLKDNNLRFFDDIKCMHEDYFFNIMCAAKASIIVKIPDKMYNYCVNPWGLTKSRPYSELKKIASNSALLGTKELYNFWKNSGYLADANAKAQFLNVIFNIDMLNKELNLIIPVISATNPELFQDEVINIISIKERLTYRKIIQNEENRKIKDNLL